MKIAIPDGMTPETIAKRALWLAWQAAGGTSGWGCFQNKPSATEADVWKNARTKGDYPGGEPERPGEVHADYVFGRMMKLSIRWNAAEIDVSDSVPTRDYQAWCGTYPTYGSLIYAAIASLNESLAPAEPDGERGGSNQ